MKTAILIHGKVDKEELFDLANPSPSNHHWFPWLQHQLIINGILAQTPEMPDAWEPVYEKWCSLFERFEINEETILIGHSCGGGFLVRWLSENKVRAGKVILVAPWLDPLHELDTRFFDFEIDSELINRTAGLTILYSTDDEESILKSVEILKVKLPNAQFQEFIDKGHFCLDDLKTDKFPELLGIVLK